MTTGIRCRLCGHADIRELDAGYMCKDHAACERRRTTGALNKLAPRKKRPNQKAWVNKFPCGHYRRKPDCETCIALRKPRSRTLAERLWEKTDRTGGPDACWLWQGACDQNGRAQVAWEGRVQPASRAAWFVTMGEAIPAHLYACHRCDNPQCVNPAHLFPGTASDNQRDAVSKGRNHYAGPGRRMTDEERLLAVERFQAGTSLCKIAEEIGVSRRSVTAHLETVGAYQRRSA